jgi:hypothetical protein
LAVDPQHPAQEVDRLHLHREGLALAQAGAGRQHDQRPVAGRHRLDEASTFSVASGSTRFGSGFGSRMPPHGEATISRSRTAARNMPARNE